MRNATEIRTQRQRDAERSGEGEKKSRGRLESRDGPPSSGSAALSARSHTCAECPKAGTRVGSRRRTPIIVSYRVNSSSSRVLLRLIIISYE